MRDWRNTVPNASFRGQPFFVESEQLNDAGRRVAIHEYAKSESHDTEDTGRKTRKFQFEAYIVGDTADVDAQAFVELCSTNGTGALILPMLGFVDARCTGCDASAEKEKQGYVKLALQFVESGSGNAFSVVALGDRIVASLQSGMAAAIGAALSSFPG